MMGWFERKSEKKSLLLTSIISVGVILLLFFFGLTYMEPPEESGITINFGTSEVGSGTNQPTTPVKTAPTKESPAEQQHKTPEQEEETAEQASASAEKEDQKAITQEEESPVSSKEKEQTKAKKNKTKKKETEQADKTKEQTSKKEEKKEEKTEPKPEKSTSDALRNVLSGKNQEGKKQQGEGNDQQKGDKGNPSGNREASSYYGQGKGLDGDGNYRLGGRKALNKKKYVQDCNESGTVVVKIRVNRQGKVVQAEPGVKGTTNTSKCLLEPAKRAALDTEFNSDNKAPSIQTGYIIYEFKLSD